MLTTIMLTTVMLCVMVPGKSPNKRSGANVINIYLLFKLQMGPISLSVCTAADHSNLAFTRVGSGLSSSNINFLTFLYCSSKYIVH